MFELDKKLNTRVVALANKGDEKAESGDWAGQIKKYEEVWNLIPEPRCEWDGCTWILGGIAEAYFQQKNYREAKKYFLESLKCEGGDEDSFVLRRLGELCYDEGDLDNAKTYLQKAWDLSEGRELIDAQKKYRDFLLKKKS